MNLFIAYSEPILNLFTIEFVLS